MKKVKETGYLSKLFFNMTWLMEILKICLEEQPLIKNYVIKHFILLKFQNMIDMNMELPQWFINFSIKIFQVVLLKIELCKTNN